MALARRRARRLGWPAVVGQLAFTTLALPVLARRGRARVEAILADAGLDTSPVTGVREVESVNSAESIALLRDLAPAVVVVQGTRHHLRRGAGRRRLPVRQHPCRHHAALPGHARWLLGTDRRTPRSRGDHRAPGGHRGGHRDRVRRAPTSHPGPTTPSPPIPICIWWPGCPPWPSRWRSLLAGATAPTPAASPAPPGTRGVTPVVAPHAVGVPAPTLAPRGALRRGARRQMLRGVRRLMLLPFAQ